MALKATIHKAELTISDMDRDYYATHALTVALHPSETEARMMLRLMAFALHANQDLAFTRGISSGDEPDLWQRNPDGTLAHWIELGQPDEKRLRKACGLARQVTLYCYGRQAPMVWWQSHGNALARLDNLCVRHVTDASEQALAALVSRQMRLNALIQDGQLWFGDDAHNVAVELENWKA
ncbi:YaeQ family protein [Alloalcanivorax mobilis]|uniref:YaeQ family protein n=1 Tax=Alloalcanivorax mobilis TaxID=2019569 RepID=UPI000B5B2A12|nr:YaeQ family protein [Alloalcanivorax mobilis]ASK35759.1 hypothetical protein CEK62_15895 [Alcanivorax sp. N3-2A]|tara:strand:+ start:6971 stop:7510 length:540 start_codon:yes stop_codon:yes gene_type:complete